MRPRPAQKGQLISQLLIKIQIKKVNIPPNKVTHQTANFTFTLQVDLMIDEQRREAERIRKANQRARSKAISEGKYIYTPLELAKQFLDKMQEPSLEELYLEEELSAKLTPADKRPLQNYLQYLKSKIKKDREEETKKQEQEQQISEKGIIFVSQKTYELHQSLLMPMNEEERSRLIKSTIENNLYLFLEYMESYQLPSNDFLKVIVALRDSLDPTSFTELFVRVCKYQKIEELRVDQDMVKSAIVLLVDKKKDDKAAYGLLRLIYINNVSLSSFQKTTLIKFQDDYEQSILRFFKSICPLETQITESLPASAFCFTTPVLQALNNEGRPFSTQIPYQFMPYLIQIICYSFTESLPSFQKFLDTFKGGMREHFNTLVQNKFTDLLQRILDETIAMKPLFFGQLDQHTTILERAFSLLKQRQIVDFSYQTIQNLIVGDHDTIKQMTNGPRIVPLNSQMKLKALLKDLKKINLGLEIDMYDLERDIDEDGRSYFKAIGIEVPLPLQAVCFNFCTSQTFKGRWLVQLDTGTGKTALCFTIACHYASMGNKVFIINVSEELTFRDYKKASQTIDETGISICLLEDPGSYQNLFEGIAFASFKVFSSLLKNSKGFPLEECVVVVDEFDQIIFGEYDHTKSGQELLARINTLIGLSGSDMKDFHVRALEQVMVGQTVKMNITNIYKPEVKNWGADVFSKISDYRLAIEQMSLQQVTKTPVIIIADDEKLILTKKLQSAGIPVQPLFQKSITDSNGSLSIFTKKQNGKYPVFIINDSQGRGLDFPSSTEIEEEGGIFLIIGIIPSSYLQFRQFLGRTGRMGNKSQHCVILHDQQAKNEEGKVYLEKMLESLYNFDVQRASSIINSTQKIKSPLENSENLTKLQGEVQTLTQNSLEKSIKSDKQNSKEFENDLQCNESIGSVRAPPDQIEKEVNTTMKKDNQDPVSSPKLPRKRDFHATSLDLADKTSGASFSEKDIQRVDFGYFEGYSKLAIHNEMCEDKKRLDAYGQALKKLCPGKTVLDIGAGTGVLSFMAIEAGASMVYAIEKAEIWKKFKKEINNRQLKATVKIMNCKAEEAPLDDISAEVIVSEWMGYFLLCERMLPSVLFVRDRCLSQGGMMIPGKARIKIAAAELPPFAKLVVHERTNEILTLDAFIQTVAADQIVSTEELILDLVLKDTESNFDTFSKKFAVVIAKKSLVNALVGWFEVEMTDGIWMSTSPFEARTHWEQTVFPITSGAYLEEGEVISGQITCKPIATNYRGLDLVFELSISKEASPLIFNYYLQ